MSVPKKLSRKLRENLIKHTGLALELIRLAEDVEARLMKKTTQRSPEFHGGCNC